MAVLTDTFALPAANGAFQRLMGRIRARAEASREIARVRGELTRMTDRELADIGIARCQIDDVARSAVE